MKSITVLPQGGTAVGTGINTHSLFSRQFLTKLSNNIVGIVDIKFIPTDKFFRTISSQDLSVAISSQLRLLATSLYKISTDLRWMNSSSLFGLAKIELEALQLALAD